MGYTNTVWVGGVVFGCVGGCFGARGIKVTFAGGFQEFGRKQEINKLGRYRTVGGGIKETAILVRRRWLAIVYRKWVGGPVLHL